MSEEITKHSRKPQKTNVSQTLKVKDVLPDLSEELKKQGGKPVESNAKPQVIYQSEGYDYNVLTLDDDSLDISKALNQNVDNSHKPSASLKYSEEGYDVQTLSIKEMYPELQNVEEGSEKYDISEKSEKANEGNLLKSISNANFKPFYEEVNNKPDNSSNLKELHTENKVESEQDKNVELNQKTEVTEVTGISEIEKTAKTAELTETAEVVAPKSVSDIKEQQNNQQIKNNDEVGKNSEPQIEECNINGGNYVIIKTAVCTPNKSLCLVKSEKDYAIVGKINDNYIDLKHYDSLASELFQARKNEIKPDGSIQYIVKVSVHKFIISITDSSMEFIMDLC